MSVCELRVKRDLRILDLTQSTRTINPFLEGDGLLSYWVELDDLLGRMAWTLATPLHRDDNPLDYAPSQKLSEFAKEVGFDGVRYPSAMDTEGMNLVIFDPCACDIGNSRLVKVTTVELEYTDELWRLN